MNTLKTITPVGFGVVIPGRWAGFVPDFCAPDVVTLDFGEIRDQMGLRSGDRLNGMFDLDRTLRPVDEDTIAPEVIGNINRQLADGRLNSATIASNSRHDIGHFAAQFGGDVQVFTRRETGAAKPSLAFFESIVAARGIEADEAMVMVGDMYTRDVLVANRARRVGMNVVSIAVEPLGDRDRGGDYLVGRLADNCARWLGGRALRRTLRSTQSV